MQINCLHIALDVPALFLEVVANCREKLRVCEPVRRPSRFGNKSAADLVLTLRTWLEDLLARLDAVFDALVIAGLEVQGVVVAIAAPITAPSLAEYFRLL